MERFLARSMQTLVKFGLGLIGGVLFALLTLYSDKGVGLETLGLMSGALVGTLDDRSYAILTAGALGLGSGVAGYLSLGLLIRNEEEPDTNTGVYGAISGFFIGLALSSGFLLKAIFLTLVALPIALVVGLVLGALIKRFFMTAPEAPPQVSAQPTPPPAAAAFPEPEALPEPEPLPRSLDEDDVPEDNPEIKPWR